MFLELENEIIFFVHKRPPNLPDSKVILIMFTTNIYN